MKYYRVCGLFLMMALCDSAYSQSIDTETVDSDEVAAQEAMEAEEMAAESDSAVVAELLFMTPAVDSLLNAWYANRELVVNDFVPDTIAAADTLINGIPDEVFVDRLQAMQSMIPMTYNEQVKRFIELYVVKRRALVQRMLGQAKYYFPMFEEALDAQGLPLELKFLPIIESALNPRAYSRAGASGLWQFMYYTGKRYDLQVNSYIDERCDPYKASWAAAKFLGELYSIYHNWHLAIAAYNCGPGNVNRAIARSGGQKDFWKIYYHLPRETRGYVPAFIAAAYAMTYAAEHQLYATATNKPVAADTIMVTRPLHFEQVSSKLGLPVDLLRELNPQYRHDIIPAQNGKNYALRLPVELTLAFAAHEDSIYAYQKEKYFPDNKIVAVSDAKYVPGAAPANSAKLIYTVKKDDVPGSIASRFGVRLNDLKYWNGMRRNIIRIGQKLVIYVPKSRADKYAGMAQIVK
ncbi:MAG: transglycosylase SLT domain-containing protein [Bacteroidales bacterium]|nr:transglycosylase SLT domain-containing protein [Bacteroidales bacterium]